jgi:glycine/D-amino acid oxidase-like deaminating enzyme
VSGAPEGQPSWDVAVLGGGVMGMATALFLARGGMRVVLLEQGALCRAASGVNAGTLTLHMTRAALIPYAMRGFAMWQEAESWLGRGVDAVKTDGLCLAFTPGEAELLAERVRLRRAAGAPVALIEAGEARRIEPGLSGDVLLAAHSPIDGHARANLTGFAFRGALAHADVEIREGVAVKQIEARGGDFRIGTKGEAVAARRIVLAGGAWLGGLLALLGVPIAVKALINQLAVTERMAPAMRCVLTIANGLLSLKQFGNGTVLIGGGWQGRGDLETGETAIIAENLRGNVRLAAWVVPKLKETRIVRAWLGFEAETADAMPLLGPVPGVPGAYAIGAVHSGYTSGPFMARLLAQAMLGEEPELPLFDPARLLAREQPERGAAA